MKLVPSDRSLPLTYDKYTKLRLLIKSDTSIRGNGEGKFLLDPRPTSLPIRLESFLDRI